MICADLGENLKQEQEPEWQTPLDTKRNLTDFTFLVVFCFFSFSWLIMGAIVLLVNDEVDVHYSKTTHHDQFYQLSTYLSENFHEAIWLALVFVALSALLLAIFVIMFRWLTKLLVFSTIFLMSALLATLSGTLLYAVYRVPTLYPLLIPLSMVAVIYGVTLHSIKNFGIEPVCKVLKMSCKAMFFFPTSTLIATLVQFGLQLITIGFSTSVFLFLSPINMPEHSGHLNMTDLEERDFEETINQLNPLVTDQIMAVGLTPKFVVFFHVVNVCGAIWVFYFIDGLVRMILTATFATWYYTDDKERLSTYTMLQCAGVIVQYHLGTVAFGSSIFVVLPMVCVVFKHGRDKLGEMCRQPSCVLAWMTILAKFAFDALAICAVQGGSFYKSAKDSYILLMKYPLSFLTINFITECVIIVGLVILQLPSVFSSLTYVCFFDGGCSSISDSVHETLVYLVAASSVLMSWTFFSVFRAALNTIRYCYLQDSKFSHESEMDLYEIVDEPEAKF